MNRGRDFFEYPKTRWSIQTRERSQHLKVQMNFPRRISRGRIENAVEEEAFARFERFPFVEIITVRGTGVDDKSGKWLYESYL